MRKIINGRRYDTERATELGYDVSECGPRDFKYWRETLYIKRTGEYFLHGVGGPASRYSVPTMDGWTGGERIIPMSLEAAQKWAEEHLTADDYEDIFGVVEETEERKTATFSLPLGIIEQIARKAAERGINKSDYIAQLVSADSKEVRMRMYAVRDMTMADLDEAMADVEKKGAMYLPEPVLETTDLEAFARFVRSRQGTAMVIEEYDVDEDGIFLDGSDYDTAENWIKRH